MYKYIVILLCFVSCQKKKEHFENDLLKMVFQSYYSLESVSNQDCIYVDASHTFEKNIYYFVVSGHSCDEELYVPYKKADYQNKTIFLTEDLPFNTIEDFTEINFVSQPATPLDNITSERTDDSDTDKTERFYYTVQIQPYKILKISRLDANDKISDLFIDSKYKEPQTNAFSEATFSLIKDSDTLKIQLKDNKLYKNDTLVNDEKFLKFNYFSDYIRNLESLRVNEPYEYIIDKEKQQGLPWDFFQLEVMYNDKSNKTFEAPLQKVKMGQEFYNLVCKLNAIENTELFIKKSADKIYRFVERKASPDYSFFALSEKMLHKYPDLKTNVKLWFIVEKDGSLSELRFLDKGVLNEEEGQFLIKTIENAGKWNAGKRNDTIVRTEFVLPLKINP